MANGDTLMWFNCAMSQESQSATNAPSIYSRGSGFFPLRCGATGTPEWIINSQMPNFYGGSGVTVHVWFIQGGTSQTAVTWEVGWKRITANTDMHTAITYSAPSTTVSVTPGTTTNGTFRHGSANFSPTDTASLVAGDMFSMRVRRNDSNPNNQDLWLVELEDNS